MRAKPFLFAAALGLLTISAPAGTVQNFVIVSASNLSPTGGVFDAPDGGRYLGSFAVDQATLPTQTGINVPLVAFDVTVTASAANPSAFPGAQYRPDLGSLGWIALAGTFTDPFSDQALASWGVEFWSSGDIFLMEFVNVESTFTGGQVIFAYERRGSPFRTDTHGSALALDPLFLAPEPGTLVTMLGGAALLCLAERRRRKRS